ncbi:hypothetical protein F5883DRAFT_572427 [Diaporthe sp. PMI_573]|nr:hypothetical protein F5883DRAFT_572427 [Diaporthaceae sp. PMI_573]
MIADPRRIPNHIVATFSGEEVTVLPCKHWFHGECVVSWLKMHNTCPICRASIEN